MSLGVSPAGESNGEQRERGEREGGRGAGAGGGEGSNGLCQLKEVLQR